MKAPTRERDDASTTGLHTKTSKHAARVFSYIQDWCVALHGRPLVAARVLVEPALFFGGGRRRLARAPFAQKYHKLHKHHTGCSVTHKHTRTHLCSPPHAN